MNNGDTYAVCPNCGKEIHSPALFCPNCGSQLSAKSIVQDNLNAKRTSKKRKTAAIISGIAAIVTVCIVVAVFIYINAIQNDLTGLLNKGDIAAVSNLYREKYASGIDKQQEFMNEIYTFMSQKYDEYNNEKISYESASLLYEQIHRDIVEANGIQGVMKLSDYEHNIENLKASKDAYYAGTNNLKQKDYANAIQQYSQVIQADTNYSKAQSESEQAKSTWKSEALAEADTKVSSGDYEGAISDLQAMTKYFPTETSITDKIAQIVNIVVENSIKQAESDFSNNGYQTSINDIQKAIQIVGDNAQLNSVLEKYQAYIPVKITDIECSERSKNRFSKSITGTDNTNDTHDNVIYAYHHGFGKDDGNQYEVYPLMGKYDTLTFEAFRNNSEKTKTSDETISINIYGDDILIKQITIDKSFMPQQYSLDIIGVQKLKIEFDSAPIDAFYWSDVLPGCIANVVVAKTQ